MEAKVSDIANWDLSGCQKFTLKESLFDLDLEQ
jgi:hypothetical protein